EPVLPWSLVLIASDAAPVNPLVGSNDKPFSAPLILASVPVNVIVESAVPSPVLKERPPIPFRVIVPFAAVSVTCSEPGPASTSAIEMWLPLPLDNTSDVSWLVLWAAGTVLTGASLTAVTFTVMVLGV